LVANTTARPGATAHRLRYARTAPASITPGRSFPENATSRSIAPAASTARFATIRQKQRRGAPPASATCSATRSSAPQVPPS
jgi:hypothetical protein